MYEFVLPSRPSAERPKSSPRRACAEELSVPSFSSVIVPTGRSCGIAPAGVTLICVHLCSSAAQAFRLCVRTIRASCGPPQFSSPGSIRNQASIANRAHCPANLSSFFGGDAGVPKSILARFEEKSTGRNKFMTFFQLFAAFGSALASGFPIQLFRLVSQLGRISRLSAQ